MHYVVLRAWRLASFTQHNIFKFFYVCVRASFLSTAEQSFTGWICRILFITSKWTFELLPLCLLQIVLIWTPVVISLGHIPRSGIAESPDFPLMWPEVLARLSLTPYPAASPRPLASSFRESRSLIHTLHQPGEPCSGVQGGIPPKARVGASGRIPEVTQVWGLCVKNAEPRSEKLLSSFSPLSALWGISRKSQLAAGGPWMPLNTCDFSCQLT